VRPPPRGHDTFLQSSIAEQIFYFGKGSETNDLYLSPVPESGADLFSWQSTVAGGIPGPDLAGYGFAGEAGFRGLTEAQAGSPPFTEIPPRAGGVLLVIALFTAVRGGP
jgi:hypothetical protein